MATLRHSDRGRRDATTPRPAMRVVSLIKPTNDFSPASPDRRLADPLWSW